MPYSLGEIIVLVIGGLIVLCAFAPGVIVGLFPKTLKKLDLDR